jgi:hypothetical protein
VFQADVRTAETMLGAAERHHQAIEEMTDLLNGQLPEPPGEDDLDGARADLDAATAALEAGVRVREAKAKKAQAEAHREAALKHARRADQLRQAGKATDDLLSEAVQVPGLTVIGGRLIYTDGDRQEPFDRLSDGKRWSIAIKIGAMRVGEKGDGTKLLILPQSCWQDFDPNNWDAINDLAILEGVTIHTAKCARGSLRAVTYGEVDTWELENAPAGA